VYPSVEGHLVYPWCGKAGETPSLIWGVWCARFLRVWESSAVGLKLCISPIRCTGGQGRVVGQYPSGIVYLGHLYAGESRQFRPLIFLVRCGTVRSGAVFCRTELQGRIDVITYSPDVPKAIAVKRNKYATLRLVWFVS